MVILFAMSVSKLLYFIYSNNIDIKTMLFFDERIWSSNQKNAPDERKTIGKNVYKNKFVYFVYEIQQRKILIQNLENTKITEIFE